MMIKIEADRTPVYPMTVEEAFGEQDTSRRSTAVMSA